MIQTGVVTYDAQTAGWNLNTGTGDRSFMSPDLSFQPPFGSPPSMALALSGIDGESTANLRVWIEPEDVEAGEFNIRIHTWADTQLHLVRVTWIAHD